ncbi:MAG: methyltransferase domain-containing protein [Candidatus Omnitrophota bacterium]
MIYDTLNPEIVKFILQDPKDRILDVGCGTGKLGRELKPKINCFIQGIEIDESAANIAKGIYDEVVIMDLEKIRDKNFKFELKEKFDYLIFGDILEHTTDPGFLLRYFRDSLNDEGAAIVSIPNIANWMIRIKLLFGNFDCDGGILNEGHLRVFTYRMAKRLLEDNGYKIIAVINNNQTWFFRFLGRYWKRLFAFQFVFKCVKRR